MPPRIRVTRPLRSLTFRPRVEGATTTISRTAAVQQRNITADEKPLPKQDKKNQPGPNQDTLPHVSEEAAKTGEITGEGGPELEQGTPVEDILARDKEATEKAPKVLKDDIKNKNNSGRGSGSRSYSTSTRSLQQQQQQEQDGLVQLENQAMTGMAAAASAALEAGHKFGLPTLPLGSRDNKNFRYEPIVKQVTGLLMKDGKLARAQTNLARILSHLRSSPPPKVNPARPLLPGSPPPNELPLDPVRYLQLIVDSVAPLLRLRSVSGLAGGGVTTQVPTPLKLRQRRRTAFKWIMDSASKKSSRSSGKGMFAQKIAEELIAVAEGRSGAWERRALLHRTGTSSRSNLGKKPFKIRRG